MASGPSGEHGNEPLELEECLPVGSVMAARRKGCGLTAEESTAMPRSGCSM